MPRGAIIVTGEPIEPVCARRGDWGTLIREALADSGGAFVELDARSPLPSLLEFDALIITGSSASVVDRLPWTVAAEARIREAVEGGVPVFGICFGHQMLGQALGGEVAKNPNGREIGTVPVELVASDPVFARVPSPFLVNNTHVDAIVRLPPGAQVLARSALDPNAAVRFGDRVLGVQFHPEIDADVMTAYVEARAPALREEGLDFARIREEIRETPHSSDLLRRFLELCGWPCAISAPPTGTPKPVSRSA